MPTFEVNDNGTVYELDAPDADAAIAAFKRFKDGNGGAQQQAPAQQAALQKYVAEHGLPGYGQAAQMASAAEAVPIVGPWLRGGLENIAAVPGMVQGQPYEQAKGNAQAGFDAAIKGAPVEAMTGRVAGTLAPFGMAGSVPIAARALGMEGGLLSQSLFGGLSGGVIAGADTLARGGSVPDAFKVGGIGLAAGAAAPLAFAGAGKAWNYLTGRNVPKAAQSFARALKDDDVVPGQVGKRLADLGDNAMVMDLGPNLQRQAGALAASPGPAQKAVRVAVSTRGANASARVANDVAQTLGVGQDIGQVADDIIASQKAASDPLYEAIRHVPLKPSGNIQFVLQTPLGKKAFTDAVELAANDGYTAKGLTVGLLDYAKRALDDIASTAARTGKNNEARQALNLIKMLLGEADNQVPAYAQARQAFAGPARVLDAIEAGSTAFTKDTTPAQLQKTLADMSQSERDGYIHGVQAWVQSKMGNAVNDPLALRNLFRAGWNEAKLRILLGSDVADDLLRRINREATFGQTANVVAGNSETAARAAAMGEVNPQFSRVQTDTVFGLLMKAINAARYAVQTPRQAKSNMDLAKALTSGGQPDPKMMQQILAAMRGKAPLPIPGGTIPLLSSNPASQ